MSYEPPRRCRIDLFTPAEKAIYDAVQAVEALPPDERLTHAVIALGKARDLVADFVDGVPFGHGYPRPTESLDEKLDAQRNAALEAAARIADRNDMSAWGIAHEIRALKTSPMKGTGGT